MSENALLQERTLTIFQNWPERPGHEKHDSDGFFAPCGQIFLLPFSVRRIKKALPELRQVAAAKLLD